MATCDNKFSQEIAAIFSKCFPYIVRDDWALHNIVSHDGNDYVEKRNEQGEMIGISVINGNTILLLCVEKKYRKQGIGSYLLEESEKKIKQNGYNEVKVGYGRI